jgi:hypothetical protein
VQTIEVGDADVKLVRLYGHTSGAPVELDVRISDLSIATDQAPGGRPQGDQADVPVGAPYRRTGLMVFLLVLCVITIAGACLLVYRRLVMRQNSGTR